MKTQQNNVKEEIIVQKQGLVSMKILNRINSKFNKKYQKENNLIFKVKEDQLLR